MTRDAACDDELDWLRRLDTAVWNRRIAESKVERLKLSFTFWRLKKAMIERDKARAEVRRLIQEPIMRRSE